MTVGPNDLPMKIQLRAEYSAQVENLSRALFGDEHYEQFREACEAEFICDAEGAAQIIRRLRAQLAEARTPEVQAELPVCAATRLKGGLTIAGKRHHDCLSQINYSGLDRTDREDGFMTNHGRFVGRHEAYEMMIRAGVESASRDGYRHGLRELFSEDLYNG